VGAEVERPVPRDEASGLHICLDASTRRAVDAFYAAGGRIGRSDNGKPGCQGLRRNYYAAFVVDPEGYRLEAYCGWQVGFSRIWVSLIDQCEAGRVGNGRPVFAIISISKEGKL